MTALHPRVVRIHHRRRRRPNEMKLVFDQTFIPFVTTHARAQITKPSRTRTKTYVFSHLSVIVFKCVSNAASRVAPSVIPLEIQRVRKPISFASICDDKIRMGF